MAYQLDDVKISPNGLNLLSPGDQVAEGDCLDLKGMWPGAVGRLEQAPGYTYLSAAHPSITIPFDSLAQSGGSTYYGGQGSLGHGSLYGIGRGGALETAIDSGYDGYPLGMIAAQGYLWIMNRNKQRKDDGTTTNDWTPAAPAPPVLTPTAISNGPLAIAEVDPVSPDGGGNFTGINLYTAASIAGIDVGTLITISGLGGSAAAMNGTWYVTAIFAGTPNNLIQLQANPSVPAGTTFATATGTFTYAPPALPLGNYNYWVTWVYANIGESNPSSSTGVVTPATATVAAAGTKINISILAQSAAAIAAGAIGWNIYRQGPATPSPYRLNENTYDLTGPSARFDEDDYGDAVHVEDDDYLINGLGIIMEGDHDPAPACRIVANQLYNGRIVVANSADFPNRIWYTPALQPGFFRGSGNPQAGDWVDIGTDRGDEILFIAVKVGYCTVYRRKSIWRVLGDFGDPNGRIDPIVPDLGVVGPRAVACTSQGDYFRGPEGIYKFNGDWAQKISQKLDPVFLGKQTETFGAGETPGQQVKCALGIRAGRLWVSYSGGGSFIYHEETARWFASGYQAGAFLDIGTSFLAAGVAYVVTLETGYSDGGTNSVLAYQSAYEDAGQPDHIKTWADLVLNHNTGGQTWTIRIRTNKGAASTDFFDLNTTINSSSLTKQIIPLVYPPGYAVSALAGKPISAFNLSVRIIGAFPLSGPAVIETPLLLHYYLEARLALVYDTDETDHGAPGVVKTVDMVEFDIDAPDGGVLQVYSDIPGGVMVARLPSGKPIAATSGRQAVRIVLDTPLDGKLLRYVATTAGNGFRVYGFRARITPIGVYADGSISETWDTRPMPIAS